MLESIAKKYNYWSRHPGFIRYSKNTAWLFSEKFFKFFVSFFVSVLVIRYLGPEDFGRLSYAMSINTLFLVVITLGLHPIVVKEIIRDESRTNILLGSAFTIQIVSFLICSLLILMSSSIIARDDKAIQYLILILVASSFFNIFDLVDSFFQAKVLSKYIVFSKMVALVVSSSLKLFFIYFNYSVLYFAIVVIVENIVVAILKSSLYSIKFSSIMKWRFNPQVAKDLLRVSKYMFFSGVVILLYSRLDQIMIRQMLDVRAVGIYASAVRLTELWIFIPTIIGSSLLPAIIVSKQKKDAATYKKRVQNLYNMICLIGLCIAVGYIIFSDFAISVLLGSEFLDAKRVLNIYIWVLPFVFLGSIVNGWLIAEDLEKLFFYKSVAGCVLNIVLNYFLIQNYGTLGAAIATLISLIFVNHIFFIFMRKTRVAFKMIFIALFFPVVFIWGMGGRYHKILK